MSVKQHPKQQVDRLIQLVRERLPEALVEVDAPARASGAWFVDIAAGGQSLVVELRPKLGFGLSSPDEDSFGEGPHEFLQSEETVAERVLALIHARQRTAPQRVHLLQELRE